jgi:hypothetical protein
LPEGSSVSLTNANIPEDTVARGQVNKGVFELSGSIPEPNLYQLNLDGVQKKSVLFIGNDKVSIKGDVATIQEISVTGSKVHDDFEEFKKTFNPLFQQLTMMGQKLSTMPRLEKEDSLMVAYKSQLDNIKSTVDKFVKNHKSSPVAPFVVIVTSEIEQDVPAL